MGFRIGFFSENLQDHFPRGARRAARAIVENVTKTNTAHDLVCLAGKIPYSRPTSFHTEPMAGWLASNPLFLSQNTLVRPSFPRTRKVLKHVLPPILVPVVKAMARYLKKSLERVGVAARQALQPSVARDPMAEEIKRQNRILALSELDAIVAFEPFDDVWSLPLENHQVLRCGWFYDAVPRRINEGENWRPEYFDAATSLMALRANHIFCDSQSAESDLHYFFPQSRGKTSVIPLGHDIPRFFQRIPQGEVTALLRRMKINPVVPYFLFVGTVEPRKNVAGILLAAQKMKQDFPDTTFQLIFVGNIPGQEQLRTMLKQTNRLLPVHTTEYLPDELLAPLMNRSVAFIYPSLWEGFGIPNLEAMTAETLVITSDVGPMPEVCKQHALYCDPYDHRSIAGRMVEALRMPKEERENRLKEAKAHAAQFTWEQTAAKMMKKVETLLDQKNRRE